MRRAFPVGKARLIRSNKGAGRGRACKCTGQTALRAQGGVWRRMRPNGWHSGAAGPVPEGRGRIRALGSSGSAAKEGSRPAAGPPGRRRSRKRSPWPGEGGCKRGRDEHGIGDAEVHREMLCPIKDADKSGGDGRRAAVGQARQTDPGRAQKKRMVGIKFSAS